jgi:activator of HSP90 ATPase
MFDHLKLALPARTPTRREAIFAGLTTFLAPALVGTPAWVAQENEISRTDESIHEEHVFRGSRKRIYETLTNTAQFDKMTHEVQAAEGGSSASAPPTEISPDAGGIFTLFGGRIVGRHIELVPNERIVQAWRAASWKPGIYSIVKFDLLEQGADTKIVFDHAGFPKGQAGHLVEGWKGHYWQPLEKFLA